MLRPLLVTVILVAVYRLGWLVPIPFVDPEGMSAPLGTAFPERPAGVHLSIFLLGVMPYVSSYILVEIFSLCIPYLKKLRSVDFDGRRKLKRIALLLALVLAVMQANSLVSSLASVNPANGKSILTVSSTGQHGVLICVLVGSFCLLVLLCELISRFGVGHGISILLLSGICGDFAARIPVYSRNFEYVGLFAYIMATVAFCGLVVLTYVLLKTRIPIPCYHEKDQTTVDYFQLNMSPSSMVALTYAATIIMVPVMLSHYVDAGGSLANRLQPGSLGYNLISIIFVFVLSFLFCWAFLHPRRRVDKMQARGWHLVDLPGNPESAENILLKKQLIYNLPWTAFLCLMVIVPSTLITTANVPFYIGGTSLPIIVAISLDLIDGVQFYQNDLRQPFKIAEFHDIYDARMIQNHMEAAGIKSHLRGYHHRLLGYFFAPHIEMSLIVDGRDREKAQGLICDYYAGLGLCRSASGT